jgi:hypothetical protein
VTKIIAESLLQFVTLPPAVPPLSPNSVNRWRHCIEILDEISKVVYANTNVLVAANDQIKIISNLDVFLGLVASTSLHLDGVRWNRPYLAGWRVLSGIQVQEIIRKEILGSCVRGTSYNQSSVLGLDEDRRDAILSLSI